MVNLPKDMNQWRLKDRIPEENKYVINNHDLNALTKAAFGVFTAFAYDPIAVFSSYHSSHHLPSTSSSQLELKSKTSNYSHSTTNRSHSIETTSIGILTETQTRDDESASQLTSLWNTEVAIADLEQQNRSLSIELNNPKVSLRRVNGSRANAKANANRAKSKLEISDCVTSDLFHKNKAIKQHDEATTKAESLQTEQLEANKTNILLKQKLDEYDIAIERFQESMNESYSNKRPERNRKANQTTPSVRVVIDIQRAEAIQSIQAVDGK